MGVSKKRSQLYLKKFGIPQRRRRGRGLCCDLMLSIRSILCHCSDLLSNSRPVTTNQTQLHLKMSPTRKEKKCSPIPVNQIPSPETRIPLLFLKINTNSNPNWKIKLKKKKRKRNINLIASLRGKSPKNLISFSDPQNTLQILTYIYTAKKFPPHYPPHPKKKKKKKEE